MSFKNNKNNNKMYVYYNRSHNECFTVIVNSDSTVNLPVEPSFSYYYRFLFLHK